MIYISWVNIIFTKKISKNNTFNIMIIDKPNFISDNELILVIHKELKESGFDLKEKENNERNNEVLHYFHELIKICENFTEKVKLLETVCNEKEDKIKELENALLEKEKYYKDKEGKIKENIDNLSKLNSNLLLRENYFINEIRKKDEIISSQLSFIEQSKTGKTIKIPQINMSSSLLSKEPNNNSTSQTLFNKEYINSLNIQVNSLKNDIHKQNTFLNFCLLELNEIIDEYILKQKNEKTTKNFNSFDEIEKELKCKINTIKNWFQNIISSSKIQEQYLNNFGLLFEYYRQINENLSNTLNKIVSVPNKTFNDMINKNKHIDETIMKNIEFENQNEINNINLLKTNSYSSNIQFYTKIQNDIDKTTKLLKSFGEYLKEEV